MERVLSAYEFAVEVVARGVYGKKPFKVWLRRSHADCAC